MTRENLTPIQSALATLLAGHDKPESVLRERLAAAGWPSQAIDEAIAWGRSRKWVDDRRVTDQLVRRRLDRRPPASRAMLKLELTERGIAAEIIQSVLDEYYEETSEIDRLRAFWRERSRSTPPHRWMARLARAGYTSDQLVAALGDEFASRDGGPDEDLDGNF